MKSIRVILTLVLLSLVTIFTGIVSADTDEVADTTVTPSPVVAGSTVFIYSELTYTASGSTAVSICVPDDWATQTTLNAVTPTGSNSAIWSIGTTAAGTSVSGVTLICSSYTTNDVTTGWDAVEWSFTVQSSATVGANRPVQVRQFPADGGVGSPYLQTVFTTVQGSPPLPTTRYVDNTTGDCAGNTPCDTGTSGLADAIAALPASGGTIVISGQYLSTEAYVGTKNILLQPLNGSSELRAADTCGSGGNAPIILNDTGNLTIDNLTINGTGDTGTCLDGIMTTGSSSSGNLIIQNGTIVENWQDDGVSIDNSSNTNVTVTDSTFQGNGFGFFLGSSNATATISNSIVSSNTSFGVLVNAGSIFIENSTLSSNTINGIRNNSGTTTARGNIISNNALYGIELYDDTSTAYANNITGNNSGGFQAYIQDIDDAAKNWWGSYADSSVGPTTDGSTPYTDGWNVRLGAAMESWAAGTDSVMLGDAQLNRTGGSTADGVIISFGRSSANAPFGNGVPPYVNLACSPFYDFYALGSPTNWRVSLPIDNTPDCNSNVLAYEIAYTITDIADCTTPDNTACWDPISPDDVLVSSNTLLIDNLDLSGTHTVAGDSSGGLDPTAVTLLDTSITQTQTPQVVGFAMILLGLAFTGFIVWRRKTNS